MFRGKVHLHDCRTDLCSQCQEASISKSLFDWNSTSGWTRSGRPVDAIICPTAPHAAVIPGRFRHVGYTSFVNVLDLTSAVFPVTHADKDEDLLSPTVSAGYPNRQHEDITLDSECKLFDLAKTQKEKS